MCRQKEAWCELKSEMEKGLETQMQREQESQLEIERVNKYIFSIFVFDQSVFVSLQLNRDKDVMRAQTHVICFRVTHPGNIIIEGPEGV